MTIPVWVLLGLAPGIQGRVLDGLAITILVARICQSSIHVLFEQTNAIAALRFTFFFIQAARMIAMGVIIVVSALG
jgi:hypothetical protein